MPRERVDLGDCVLPVRVDGDERDPFLRELDGELLHAVCVEFCQRAFGPEEDDRHALVMRENVAQRVIGTPEVL